MTQTKTASSRRLSHISLILLMILPLLLAGCGQKGKLYLPDEARSTSQQHA